MFRESFCSCRSLSSKVMPGTLRLLANVPATILPKKKTTGQTTSKEEGRSPPSLPPRHPHVSPYWVPASPTSVRHRCWILFQWVKINFASRYHIPTARLSSSPYFPLEDSFSSTTIETFPSTSSYDTVASEFAEETDDVIPVVHVHTEVSVGPTPVTSI